MTFQTRTTYSMHKDLPSQILQGFYCDTGASQSLLDRIIADHIKIIAYVNDAPVGFISAEREKCSYIVHGFYVEEEYRKHCVGRRLLCRIIAHAKKEKVSYVLSTDMLQPARTVFFKLKDRLKSATKLEFKTEFYIDFYGSQRVSGYIKL